MIVVDDQAVVRAGFAAIVDAEPDMTVVGEAGDGASAVELATREAPDLVLMDIRMPGIDGVEATRRIRKEHPPEKLRVIVLTTFDQDDIVLAALRAGANGFLSKTVSPAELVAGITEVVGGGGALSAAATAALIGHMTDSPPPVIDQELLRRFDALTPRERDVVVLVASGLGNDEIAAQMYVSPFTVKTHAVRAMTKVGARDRAQLVSFAFRAGLYP